MSVRSKAAIAACGMLAVIMSAAVGAAEVSSNATSACMSAVNHKYNGRVKNLSVVRSEFSQANSEVIVNADGEHWRCLVSNGGKVEELSKQGGHQAHASTAASNDAESACMAAVDRNNGGKTKSLRIVGTEPHPAQGKTIVNLNADGVHWRCVASNDGVVEDLKVK